MVTEKSDLSNKSLLKGSEPGTDTQAAIDYLAAEREAFRREGEGEGERYGVTTDRPAEAVGDLPSNG